MFEAASGRKAFRGDDVSETLASVLRDEPTLESLPTDAAKLVSIVRRCLRKDARRRFHHMGDVRVELEETITWPGDSETQVRASTRQPFVFGAIAGALIALALGRLLWAVMAPNAQPIDQSITFAIDLDPVQPRTADIFGPSLAISPDGSAVALVGYYESGHSQLYVRSMHQLAVLPLADTQSAMQPFFSPDGQWIGFFDGARLKSVATGWAGDHDRGAGTIDPRRNLGVRRHDRVWPQPWRTHERFG